MSIYLPAQKNLDLADATATEVRLPEGSKGHLIRLTPEVDYQFGFDEATVAADEGMPMNASEAIAIDDIVGKSSLWIKQSSGGAVDIRWAYLYPKVR